MPRVFSRHLRVLAADAPRLHGLTYSLAILDELQAFKSDEVYIALSSALHKRPDAKMVTISTAGQGADSPLGQLRARALAQPKVTCRGSVTDACGPGLRLLEWATPEDADVDDAKLVKRANPRLMGDRGRDRGAQGRTSRPCVPAVRREPVDRAGGSLAPSGGVAAMRGRARVRPGERVWVGCDVGGERSASAVCWVNEGLQVGCEVFHGEGGVLDCLDLVRDLGTRFEVAELVYDPWRFGQAAQELEREGVTTTQFAQTDQRMIPASARLHTAIVERRITLPDDPELARHAANAVARHSRRGWRLDKPTKETNIDGVVALCMALERCENQPEPVRLVGWL